MEYHLEYGSIIGEEIMFSTKRGGEMSILMKKKPSELFKSGEMQWVQNTMYKRELGNTKIIGCCMIGLLVELGLLTDVLTLDTPEPDKRVTQLSKHITERLGYKGVADWNDVPERTKEEVIAMLERFDL